MPVSCHSVRGTGPRPPGDRWWVEESVFPLQERMGPGPAGNAPAGGRFRRVTGRSPSVLEGGADPTWSLSGPQE